MLSPAAAPDSRDLVQAGWRAAWGKDFDARWRDALRRGFVADSAMPLVTPSVVNRNITIPDMPQADGLSIVLRPDPTIWDGRFASNAWLQETPKPLTKMTWDNVVAISPQLAVERGIANGDELRLEVGGTSVTGPAWIMPGQEPHTIALALGYGRERAGRTGSGLGFNAATLQRLGALWHQTGVTVTRTGAQLTLATTQQHQAMDGFDFVRTVAAGDEKVLKQPKERAPSFYPPRKWDSPSWGMSIDLDLCIGCNACVVACMAENNIARRRQGIGRTGPGNALAAHRPLLRRRSGGAEILFSAGAMHALRAGALRDGLPRQCRGAQFRRPQSAGLQPLYRHAHLLLLLPLQGAAFQLVRLYER